MKPTRIAATGLAFFATAMSTGCRPATTAIGAGPSTTPSSAASTTPSSSAPATGPSTTPSSAVSAARASSAPAAGGDGCPVSAKTLLTALQHDAQRYDSINRPTAVLAVTCYHGYATALEVPPPNTETAAILYRYSAGTGAWSVLSVGTSIGCLSLGVPADVTAHLPHCDKY